MKVALGDAMCRRFSYIRSSEPFLAATLLDPRFKDTYFDAQESLAAREAILNFLSSVHALDPSNKNTPVTTSTGNVEP